MLLSLRKRVAGLLWLAVLVGFCLGSIVAVGIVYLAPWSMAALSLSCGVVGAVLQVFLLIGWSLDKRDLDDHR